MDTDKLNAVRNRVNSMMENHEDPEDGAIFTIGFGADLIDAYDAANARIAELEAQVNAVPVQALIALHDYSDICTQAQIDEVSAWIDTQVTA